MMAAGARPERISGKAREACSATSAKSHTIARPKPKPNAWPWTSAILIKGVDRRAAFNLRIRADSRRIAAGVRPARSRPVQKTLPRARMRKTRGRGLEASWRARYTRNAGLSNGAETACIRCQRSLSLHSRRGKKNRGDLPVGARLPSSVVGQRMAGTTRLELARTSVPYSLFDRKVLRSGFHERTKGVMNLDGRLGGHTGGRYNPYRQSSDPGRE